jgi:hypothetical protein
VNVFRETSASLFNFCIEIKNCVAFPNSLVIYFVRPYTYSFFDLAFPTDCIAYSFPITCLLVRIPWELVTLVSHALIVIISMDIRSLTRFPSSKIFSVFPCKLMHCTNCCRHKVTSEAVLLIFILGEIESDCSAYNESCNHRQCTGRACSNSSFSPSSPYLYLILSSTYWKSEYSYRLHRKNVELPSLRDTRINNIHT